MTTVSACDKCFDKNSGICKICLYPIRTDKEIIAIFELRKKLGTAPDDHMGNHSKRIYEDYIEKSKHEYIMKKWIDKEKLLKELKFLRRHYDRLAELMGVVNTERSYEHKLQHKGKVKFIDYLILRIKDKDFE